MSETFGKISCESCVGACCKDARLALSADEADRLTDAGSVLVPILIASRSKPGDSANEEIIDWAEHAEGLEKIGMSKTDPAKRAEWLQIAEQAETMLPGEGLFALLGACAFLKPDGRCGSYNDRPQICRKFPPSSQACIDFRQKAGISLPVTLVLKPELM